MAASSLVLSFFLFTFLVLHHYLSAQQTYLANTQFDCYENISSTLGYVCNGQKSCTTYLTYRSLYPYNTALAIGYLLNSDPKDIAEINGISDVVERIPDNTLVLVRLSCSCSGPFYQYNASYTIKEADTYLFIANDTYQGLTTCQALMNQNLRYDSYNLEAGMEILVPLRCACPSRVQISSGVNFLLTYITDIDDYVEVVSDAFGVDHNRTFYANNLTPIDTIYPFTPLLIPLKTAPTFTQALIPAQPPESESPQPGGPVLVNSKSEHKWAFLGVGIGIGFGIGVGSIFIAALCIWFFLQRWRQQQEKKKPLQTGSQEDNKKFGKSVLNSVTEGARNVIVSLMEYKFEDLQLATDRFSEDRRIKGSVYRGLLNGDNAAVKRMEGDVLKEISILKQISHSNVIWLLGFCLHEGNTYLVYEFAENGTLGDRLHEKNNYGDSSALTWKQRVHIAYDVASGLNYLHNYANPPFIHKDLKSSNVLLDGNFRAKVANFGLARSVPVEEDNDEPTGLQITRHVVGTQGYMAPEYLEHGLITPKLDVFAMGVILLELLSGREAAAASSGEKERGDLLLWKSIKTVMEGDNVRGKLKSFIDPFLRQKYPLELAFSMVELAVTCVAQDLNARPTVVEVSVTLSNILSSTLEWDASGFDE